MGPDIYYIIKLITVRIKINYINSYSISTTNNYGIQFLEGKINIESKSTPIIDTSYPILTSNSPISSIYSLFSRKVPWAMYFAEDFSGNTLPNYLNDVLKNATTTGTISKETASGNGTTGAITYIKGDTTTTVTFPNGSIPTNFTICSLTRYTGVTFGRILEGTNNNWLHGHWNGNRGVAHYNEWKTANQSVGTQTDWLCMIGKNADTPPTNILADGVARGVTSRNLSGLNLRINNGEYSGEKCNWALSCVMIWESHLTDDEMVDLNTIINTYKNTGISIKNLFNSTISSNIQPVLWYKFENGTNFLNQENNSAYNLINSSTTFDTTTFIKGTGSIKCYNTNCRY